MKKMIFFDGVMLVNNKDLFSIGEIAKAIGITRKIILNYEAKGLIKPDKKYGNSGNRYYTIDTLTQIRTVRLLQNLGLSLDEVREYLNDKSDLQSIIKRLEKMRNELDLTIEKLKERDASNEEVAEITVLPQTIYRRTYNSVTIADKTNLLRNTALEAIKKHGTDTSRRMYFTEYSADEPEEIAYCVAVPAGSEGEYVLELPELKAIAVFHHGAYEDIPQKRKMLIKYAEENNIRLSGVFRNLYLEGPPQHKDKSRFITQVIALTE